MILTNKDNLSEIVMHAIVSVFECYRGQDFKARPDDIS